MNRAARSVFAWGIYLVLAGLGFFLMPNVVLPLFRFAATSDSWVRVLGLLVTLVGAYYLASARQNVTPFFRMTVWGRTAFAAGALLLVLMKFSELPLLLIGAADAAGAVWTWLSLRSMTEMRAEEAPLRV